MTKSRMLIQLSCLMLCGVVLNSCIGKSVDQGVAALENAITVLDQNSSAWQTTITNLEQDLVTKGQSTLANEVQSLANRAIGTAGSELRCNVDFVGQRVNQGLRRILARLKGQSVAPLVPGTCTVDPPEIQVALIGEGRLTSLNYYGYDMFERDASDTRMKIFLRDRDGREEDVTSALALPTHYLMTIRLADDRVHFTDRTDKLIVRWEQSILSTINVIQPPVQPPPVIVSGLQVAFHTNDEDKDDNTGVAVTIQNVAEWHQTQNEVFPDGSDRIKNLNPSSVPLSNLSGHLLEVCISPVGNDTWRFNMTLSGTRSDGQRYFFSANSIELNQDQTRRCKPFRLP
jgi:hypothetical protein